MKYKSYSVITFTTLLAAFLAHNFEEAYMICTTNVQSPLSFIQPPTCRLFIWMVSIVSIAAIFVYRIGIKSKKTSTYLRVSNLFAAVLLFNVFIPHVTIAIYTWDYTPGIISAVLLNLPLSILLLILNKKSLRHEN